MPFIEVFTTPRTEEEKQTIMKAVRGTVSEAFDVGEEFTTVWLHEFPEGNILASVPIITVVIHCFSGRTVEQKRVLYARLNETVKNLAPEISRCQIVVDEACLENWGIGNGQCAADII